MALRLHYFARALTRVGGRPQGGEPLPFLSARDAEAGGEMLAKLEGAAVAYQQMGDPDFNVWEEPELLGIWGDISPDDVLTAA